MAVFTGLGSAASPSITFSADTNTGIFSPGADQVAISTNGTGRLFVDASGNVEIKGQGDLRFADSDSSNWVAFQAPATVASDVTWTLPDADGTANQVLSTNGSGTLSWATGGGGGGGTKIEVGNTSAEVVDTGTDGRFVVTTEGTGRMTVDSSGRTLLGGVTANANGGVLQLSGGITFPATAVAATDANTLDDYEEGTWTPTQGAELTVVGTFSSSGVYTRIGRTVILEGVVSGSTSVSVLNTNQITIGGLPFGPSFSRSQGIAGNEAITASATFQIAGANDIYFMQTMAATANIRFAAVFTSFV
jgi:hypothetical protein